MISRGRKASGGHSAWRRIGVAAALAATLAIPACDPCAGLVGCNAPAHIGVTGQILNDTTGKPERGAIIDLIRVSGASVEQDSVRTTTDAFGMFSIEVRANESGRVLADIVVRPAHGPGYRATGLHLATSTRRGDVLALRSWSTVPHATDFGEAFRRGGSREVLSDVAIEFRRTGGVPLRSGSVFRTKTNTNGFFPLFGDSVVPVDAGDVVGDLTIFLPSPGPTVHRNFRVRSAAEFRSEAIIQRVGAGPSLDYGIEVRRRARPDLAAGGVRVDFVRTSGLDVVPSTWSATTDGIGRVVFASRALTTGLVTGDITVTPPAPWKTVTLTGQQFATFDADSIVPGPRIEIGPAFHHHVIIRAKGARLNGAKVDVRRVSGVELLAPLFSAVTDDSGVVNLRLEPTTEGELTADITVTPPMPYASFTVRGVRLSAVDADVPGGSSLLGDWDVTNPPTAAIRKP